MEYELIRHRYRLRDVPTREFTWRDLWVVLLHAPDDSGLARAVSGCGHTAAEHLAILELHSLSIANWQRAHGKKNDQPKIMDCLLPEEERATTRYGTASMSLEETADWLGWADRPAA